MLNHKHMCLFFVLFVVNCANAWDQDELAMFDLVEELKSNFYDYLDISQTATVAEVKKAYRKMSVKMHPDKNVNDPDADNKFRQLVGVYEILKNTELRASYDDILANGLPSWRTPVFYYRKLRKMSNIEVGLLVAVLSTTVHYAALLGARYERLWTMEEQLSTTLKRYKARDRKREIIDQQIAERLNEYPKLKWHDLLPFALCKGTYSFIMFLPVLFGFVKWTVKQKIEEKRQINQELCDDEQKRQQAKVEKQERKRRHLEKRRTDVPAQYDAESLNAFLSLSDLPTTNALPVEAKELSSSNTEWSEDEIIQLVQAIARYPGGVPNRWERISTQLDRTVAQVTGKARQLGQTSCAIPTFEVNENHMCGDSDEDSDDEADTDDATYTRKRQSRLKGGKKAERRTDEGDGITNDLIEQNGTETNEDQTEDTSPLTDDEPYMSRKKLKQQKISTRKTAEQGGVDTGSITVTDGWTQLEQKQLEVAIRSIVRDVPERWDRIAECVPSKTKVEVMQRVKYLSTVVKSRSTRS